MHTVIELLYGFSVACHAIALVIGFVTLAKHGCHFRNSCPTQILRSTTEQKYWAIACSTICNCIIIGVLAPKWGAQVEMQQYGGMVAVGFYHALAGFVMVLWHTITLLEMNATDKGVANA